MELCHVEPVETSLLVWVLLDSSAPRVAEAYACAEASA